MASPQVILSLMSPPTPFVLESSIVALKKRPIQISHKTEPMFFYVNIAKHRKRQLGPSLSSYLDNSSSRVSEGRRSNTALFLEDIKQEVDKFDYHDGTPSRSHSTYKRRSPDSHMLSDLYPGTGLARRGANYSLKACNIEEDATLDVGETTFALFVSLLDSSL